MAAQKLNDITGAIVDCCFKVHKAMGPGLYEKVYEECIAHELGKKGLRFDRQKEVTVEYEDLVIPQAFRLDLLVEDKVIVELKSVYKHEPVHEAQILTYMRLAQIKTGLLVNFNVPLIKQGIKRFRL